MNTKKNKHPWPTKKVMKQIYTMKLWGNNHSEFYSGIGSHDPKIVQPYINAVSSFLNSFKTPLVVCDLGCGDFNVGQELVFYSKKFIGVDIVDELIKHNKEKYINENLEFKCLDIAIDNLPYGDCALVRQVLQHLSNKEVSSVLKKLTAYKYVILTEHLPKGEFVPNRDIISGQGIRLKKQSGLQVLAPPFNFKVKKESQLLAYELDETNGIIVTTLYELF